MYPIFCLFLACFAPFFLQAQRLQQLDIRVDRQNKIIAIPFLLQDLSRFSYEYDLRLYYKDKGDSLYRGPLSALDGYYGGRILAQPQDTLWMFWAYGKENPHLEGDALQLRIEASYQSSVLNLKNEEAMIYSLLLPGWGQSKVRYFEGWQYKWLTITLAVYSTAGLALWFNEQTRRAYDEYKRQDNRQGAQLAYLQAEEWRQRTLLISAASLALWVGDIIVVGLRGAKNRKDKKNILAYNEQIKQRVRLQLLPIGGQAWYPILGWQYRF